MNAGSNLGIWKPETINKCAKKAFKISYKCDSEGGFCKKLSVRFSPLRGRYCHGVNSVNGKLSAQTHTHTTTDCSSLRPPQPQVLRFTCTNDFDIIVSPLTSGDWWPC
ncbi:hypothetical protein EVAR_46503_1 [Eumeta japonica]|uniref:Uncharacterized protein n=1 Tax=Eumeta variegata TaxID=151549 RepID=A0A4C1WVJ8_EUMVA|nr:hypothetical protein EVAR_46503_1 [Eumeta japonica]